MVKSTRLNDGENRRKCTLSLAIHNRSTGDQLLAICYANKLPNPYVGKVTYFHSPQPFSSGLVLDFDWVEDLGRNHDTMSVDTLRANPTCFNRAIRTLDNPGCANYAVGCISTDTIRVFAQTLEW